MRLIILITFLMSTTSVMAKVMSSKERARLVKACLKVHAKSEQKLAICECTTKNLDQVIMTSDIPFLLRYYKKGTPYSLCQKEYQEMLCKLDFNIASECQKNHQFNIKKDKMEHAH